MQTLRRRTSPCKYKNDPSRFLGEGITFKAKLIGILEVSEARGDKMCQDALNDLKTAIRAAGEHKQRITISISIDGLRLRDEKTGDCLYHHPVHKISFIAQDMSDSRAFGYIFGSPDTGHRFFGIKTDKTASQVVISMRDLFQVVFELKKKEIEMAKNHSDQAHVKYGSTGYIDSMHLSKDESEFDRNKGKYSQIIKSRCLSSKSNEASSSDFKVPVSEAIADLLDLEQGISQMDKISSSDPFDSLCRDDPYDPFDDSFSKKLSRPTDEKVLSDIMTQSLSETASELEKNASFFESTPSTSKANFFCQFSPEVTNASKTKISDHKWFEQESNSPFEETIKVNNVEPINSSTALNTPAPETERSESVKSPIKTDLFTELDPLGTGRVKPYVDKKDFFQELKNPPKKILKEIISDSIAVDTPSLYFPAQFTEEKNLNISKFENVSESIKDFNDSSISGKNTKTDPFDNSDPFKETDPFQEENFPCSSGFFTAFGAKSSLDEIFDDKTSWKLDKFKDVKDEKQKSNSPVSFSLFSSGALRVSLPPEKIETKPTTLSSSTTKVISPPNSPEDLKALKRKFHQTVQEKSIDTEDDALAREEPFIRSEIKITNLKAKSTRSPYKERYSSMQSPPTTEIEKVTSKMYSSVEILEATTPDPPPRAKTAVFSIKPPPLPPKRPNQSAFKPPARPPSTDDQVLHYDKIQGKKSSDESLHLKEEFKDTKLKKKLFTEKECSAFNESKNQFSSDSQFPVLLPPPNRKAASDGSKSNLAKKIDNKSKMTSFNDGSVLDIKLNQLDNTGLENLAFTLGIPSKNIYSMTLQDLTKMLAEKYMTLNKSPDKNIVSETFEVDFDSNFAKPQTNNSDSTYDKYAVFKELIENECKETEAAKNQNQSEINLQNDEKENGEKFIEQEEDKYAALRQLSLNAQQSETFSDNDGTPIEKKSSCDEKTVTDVIQSSPKKGILSPKDLFNDESSKSVENQGIAADYGDWTSGANWTKESESNQSKDLPQPPESQLFPLVDEFSDDKRPPCLKDNWATFEKPDFDGANTKKSLDNLYENENSPFSSDGKDEDREIPFHWHQNVFRRKKDKDVSWKDDDESWDDYSPKESVCSDESSREERSPDMERDNHYENALWNLRDKRAKERNWNEKSKQWIRSNKWQEETEDEFDEFWRKQKERSSSCESNRKNFWRGKSYEDQAKRYDWCNTWGEPWEENIRRPPCYGSRRKRSESDQEYRRRYDSDASDKECIWSFQKNYPESQSRPGKPKSHYSSIRTSRDCLEYHHDSWGKYRKEISQKRPSSASESKRNYEKMFSYTNHSFKEGDKTYPGKKNTNKEELSNRQFVCKDYRCRSDLDFDQSYKYDRKTSNQHFKPSTKNSSRAFGTMQSNAFKLPSRRDEAPNGKTQDFGCLKSFSEKKYSYEKVDNTTHFRFDSEAENFVGKEKRTSPNQLSQDFKKSLDDRGNQWALTNGKTEGDSSFGSQSTKDNFVEFNEKMKNPPKSSSSKPEPALESVEKAEEKNKNHVSKIGRQESSSLLRKSDSINIFSRDNDPFEGDDFFNDAS